MKIFRLFSLITLLMAVASVSFGQNTKTETLKVSGECGTCKKKIEKAAKEAGATYAVWSTNTKVLTIRYNSLSTNSARIQQNIANAGYDTPDYTAPDEAYNKLDQCCQYDRKSDLKETPASDKMNSCCDKAMSGKSTMDCSKKSADEKTAMNCGDNSKNCCSKKTQQ
ncbi:MAG TPA: cation transporter [Chitinophagaceae bacterium]|nr:cation transporter [Chitinophagaceae bacterium]